MLFRCYLSIQDLRMSFAAWNMHVYVHEMQWWDGVKDFCMYVCVCLFWRMNEFKLNLINTGNEWFWNFSLVSCPGWVVILWHACINAASSVHQYNDWIDDCDEWRPGKSEVKQWQQWNCRNYFAQQIWMTNKWPVFGDQETMSLECWQCFQVWKKY